MKIQKLRDQEVSLTNAYSFFVYAIRTQITRDYYLRRLRTFFDFIRLPKHDEPKTSSILLISVSIFIGIILLMYSGLMYTETMIKQYSACRDKIIAYEQSGIYTSTDQFKLALSYCEAK